MTSPPACRPPLSINGEVDWTSACGRYEKFGEVDWTSACGRCEKFGEVDWTPAAAGVYDMRGGGWTFACGVHLRCFTGECFGDLSEFWGHVFEGDAVARDDNASSFGDPFE